VHWRVEYGIFDDFVPQVHVQVEQHGLMYSGGPHWGGDVLLFPLE
jgi:hypothetical protein